MTTAVRAAAIHTVQAECSVCAVRVELVDGDVGAGLRRFREAHPLTASSPHRPVVPEGWRMPADGLLEA